MTPLTPRRHRAPVPAGLAKQNRLALALARPRAARLVTSFKLPWLVFLKMVTDRELRRAWLSSAGRVAVLTLLLGVLAVTSPWTKGYFTEGDGEEVAVAAQQDEPAADSAEVHTAGAQQNEPVADSAEVHTVAAQQDEPAADSAEVHTTDAVHATGSQATEAHGAAGDPAQTPPDHASTAPEQVGPGGRDATPARARGREGRRWSFPGGGDERRPALSRLQQALSALYAGLALVESLLLGLFRDHQNQLSRRLCVATGADPEDPEERPRVRLNWPWLKKKLTRRVRGFLIIGMGAIPITLLTVVPAVGHVLSRAAGAAWAFYWLAVFTLGTARAAWTHDLPGQPFFIRAFENAATLPMIGRVSRGFGTLWARIARTVRAGCLTFEVSPWEAIGLALARSLTVLPVINALVRPVLPVAAQLVLTARPPAQSQTLDAS